MSPEAKRAAAILIISLPTIAFGGMALLTFIRRKIPGYLDNPVRQALFRAGHAHAGVLVILALVSQAYVDAAALPGALREAARWSIAAAPILMPAGFFFSVLDPKATAPGPLIRLVYLGAAALAFGTLTLGVGLFL